MKLKTLLKLMMADQNVMIYESYNKEPSYTGAAGNTPYWLAEMEIDENSEIAVEKGDYIAINVKEADHE